MFNVVQPLSKLLAVKHFTTSDLCFVLNTKLTATILVLFSVLLSALDLFRTSIDCFVDSKDSGNRKSMMDNYCWSVGTYTCKDRGIVNPLACFDPHEENKVHQHYYQWVPLILVIQALISYLPAYLWKATESGWLNDICAKLNKFESNWKDHKNTVVSQFSGKIASRMHMSYINSYLGYKVLSLMVIVINIVMLSIIIPGYWNSYSHAIMALLTGNSMGWKAYSDQTFPTIAKCLFESTGPSGSLQKFDALCLLPQNVLNQKIFVIIWLWYIFQLVVSVANLSYFAAIYYSKNVRIVILYKYAMMTVSRKQIMLATDKAHLGYFFVLQQIAKNIDTFTFCDLLNELSLKATANSNFEQNIAGNRDISQNLIGNHDQNSEKSELSV